VIPASAQYKLAIQGPHQRAARIDAYDIDGNLLAQDVPVQSGSVIADLTQTVSRSASWTLTDEWWPNTPSDPFAPQLSVVHIRAGIRYGDNSEELFPLFVGRVQTVQRDPDGGVSLTADDLALDVIDFRFEQPQSVRTLTTGTIRVLQTIRLLITQALPQAVFKADGVTDAFLPDVTWDEDRGAALNDLAASRGARWFPDGEGRFSVQPIVYAPTITPVQSFTDGPGGMMLSPVISRTRSGAVNSITVVAERQDGTDPVRITERDTGAASPTRFGGPYGKVSRIIKVQSPLDPAEAQTLARAELAAGVALTEQWDADVVADHTLEPEDTVYLEHRGYGSNQVIDSIVYPLTVDEPMRVATRGTVTVQSA
jgi:hypothetical protein